MKKFNNQVNILTLFVRSFGFRQGVSLRPSEVVRVVRRAQDVWLTTPPGSKRTTKTSLLLGEPSFSRTLIWRNEPNFNTSNIIATSYNTVVYNGFFQISTKKRTQLKPIFSLPPNPILHLRQIAGNVLKNPMNGCSI